MDSTSAIAVSEDMAERPSYLELLDKGLLERRVEAPSNCWSAAQSARATASATVSTTRSQLVTRVDCRSFRRTQHTSASRRSWEQARAPLLRQLQFALRLLPELSDLTNAQRAAQERSKSRTFGGDDVGTAIAWMSQHQFRFSDALRSPNSAFDSDRRATGFCVCRWSTTRMRTIRLRFSQLLDRIVDIYLPDLKYADDESGYLYSKVSGYKEFRDSRCVRCTGQTGDERVFDESGLLKRGLVVRLLVLPNDIGSIAESIEWIRDELSPRVAISLMAQYTRLIRRKRISVTCCCHAALESGMAQSNRGARGTGNDRGLGAGV